MQYLFSIIFICICNCLCAQNFSAQYSVESTREVQLASGKTEFVKLNYRGYLYKSGNRYISFFKPLFLQEWENGVVKVADGFSVSVSTDTVQALSYLDLDSNIVRTRTDFGGLNKVRKFDPGIIKWQIMPDTKIINGLPCQKALLDFNGKTNLCEVWFCSDINVSVSLRNLPGLPGLLVEADYYSANEKYQLLSYNLGEDLPPSIFWPREFNQPFMEKKTGK